MKEDTIEVSGMALPASRVLGTKIKRSCSLWGLISESIMPIFLIILFFAVEPAIWLYALLAIGLLACLPKFFEELLSWYNSEWKVLVKVRMNDYSDDGYLYTHAYAETREGAAKIEEKIQEKLTVHAMKTSPLNT